MMSTEFVIFLCQMISPIVRYTKWDCKILFWVSISCFFIIQIVTMTHGLKAWSFFGIRYIHQTKTDITSFFFVWCDIILWHDNVVKREKTTCNLLNSTNYQEFFSMGIISIFQMIHCIIKNMYANNSFKIGIIYYSFIFYVSFLGARRSCV